MRSFLLALCSIFLLCSFSFKEACASKSNNALNLDLLNAIIELVKKEYVDEVTDTKLNEKVINAFLSSLDAHSSYLDRKSFDEMKIQTKGEFGGLGIEITVENSLIKIISPLDDTPAFKAGLHAGDFITHINDAPVIDMTLTEAVEKMRGAPRTSLNITILREGEAEPLLFTIMRDVIKIQAVKARLIGDVGYIRIATFSDHTSEQLDNYVAMIKTTLGDALKGLVIDMRNNPGGLLSQAVNVSDAFLEQGIIVSTRGRMASSNEIYSAHKGDIAQGLPIVILINGGSASGSEIVAGALQDHKRAIILGTKSFGKGSVQSVQAINDGENFGAIKLTTSRYYTPSGRSIQAEGIVPDTIIEQAKLEWMRPKLKISESDLRGHLQKQLPSGEKLALKDITIKQENAPSEAITLPNSTASLIKEDPASLYDKDYQLGRGVDLVNTLYMLQKNTAKKEK